MDNSLIKRQAAIDAILNDKVEITPVIKAIGNEYGFEVLNETCDRHVRMLRELPSAEPQERKIGEWIYDWGDWDFETCKCSECGNHMTTPIGERYNFCSNCGADMRGERNEP